MWIRSRQNVLIWMSLLVLKSTISVPQSIVCLGLRRSCRHNFLLRVLATRLRILDVCLPKHESAPVTMLQNNSNPLISVHTGSTQKQQHLSSWGQKQRPRQEIWSLTRRAYTRYLPATARRESASANESTKALTDVERAGGVDAGLRPNQAVRWRSVY